MILLDSIKRYRPDTRRAIEITSTYRGIDDYADKLGFPNRKLLMENLPFGATVLDIGAGDEGLKKELATSRPDLIVLSINPSLADESHRRIYSTPNAVNATNPELPIKSNSFDVVLDSMASIFYNEDYEESVLRKHTLEIDRYPV